MGQFSSREVATAVWLLLFVLWALRRGEVRKSVGGVLRSIWHFKIIASVCLMLVYLLGIVVLLAKISMWKVSLLKDTVWFLVSAMGMMMRFVTIHNADSILRTILRDNIRIVILLEFFVNTYTFPLPVELVLVPLLALITLLDVVASNNEQYAVVTGFVKGTQMVAGWAILLVAIMGAITGLKNLKPFDAFRSVALAPLLSVLMYPFIHMVVLWTKYELVFTRLALGRKKTRRLNRYAKRKVMMYAGLSLDRLQWLLKNDSFHLMNLEKESDVDSLVHRAKRNRTPRDQMAQIQRK